MPFKEGLSMNTMSSELDMSSGSDISLEADPVGSTVGLSKQSSLCPLLRLQILQYMLGYILVFCNITISLIYL